MAFLSFRPPPAFLFHIEITKGCPGGTVIKDLPATSGHTRDVSLIPGSGRSHGVSNSTLLQYLLPGESQGERSLVGYSPWGCKESDMTEQTYTHTHTHPWWKLLSKLGRARTFPNLMKNIYNKHTANILLPGEKTDALFPSKIRNRNKIKLPPLLFNTI